MGAFGMEIQVKFENYDLDLHFKVMVDHLVFLSYSSQITIQYTFQIWMGAFCMKTQVRFENGDHDQCLWVQDTNQGQFLDT